MPMHHDSDRGEDIHRDRTNRLFIAIPRDYRGNESRYDYWPVSIGELKAELRRRINPNRLILISQIDGEWPGLVRGMIIDKLEQRPISAAAVAEELLDTLATVNLVSREDVR